MTRNRVNSVKERQSEHARERLLKLLFKVIVRVIVNSRLSLVRLSVVQSYNNSPIHDYVHPDDHTQLTYEMTPGLRPFTVYCLKLFTLAYATGRERKEGGRLCVSSATLILFAKNFPPKFTLL